MKRMMWTVLVALVGVTTACDSDSTGPVEEVSGTYDMELTGALNESAEGPAWFGTDVDEEGDDIFLLMLGDEDSRHLVLVGHEGTARPAVGTYDIAANAWELLHFVSDDEELLGMFYGIEGELEITSSSSGRLRGTITFVATDFFGGEEELEGSITFDALPAPVGQMSSVVSVR
jgi:hypothetical protein